MNTLKTEYLKRAIDTGNKNAVNLVREFFDGGVFDFTFIGRGICVDVDKIQWTLTDLDRALDVMELKSELEIVDGIKTKDNRAGYTKALVKCSIHDADKFSTLKQRIELQQDAKQKEILINRLVEVTGLAIKYHHDYYLEGCK